MLYRNKKTGLELELKSVIISPDFELVSEKKRSLARISLMRRCSQRLLLRGSHQGAFF